MIQPEAFDAFYKDARTRLLAQTYALTGDLPAARSAVRDSFIVTWHHWRKVQRLPDPEAWVRPHAWSQAQRRHTARIWHRDKSLDPEAKATFDALGKLSLPQRKALVLDRFTTMPLSERARELGVPMAEAERTTTAATEKFIEQRDVAADRLPELFGQLGALVEDAQWPRASILRRAGAARRRTHTIIGAAAAVAAVVVTGTVVSGSTLEGQPEASGQGQAASSGEPPAAETYFTGDRLLEADELGLYLDGPWRTAKTFDNSRGSGRVAPCQQERYADPDGVSTLVRTFETTTRKGQPEKSAVQYAELSSDVRSSRRAWHRMVRWYGGCVTPRVQLISTYAVSGVGDAARLFHLRSWRSPATTYVVGVARTGPIVTTTLTRTTAEAATDLHGEARFLGGAINGLCTTIPGASCATDPVAKAIPPVRVGEVPSLLIEADLPPVNGVSRPWVGIRPREARDNVAATGCDRTDFSQKGISSAVTRTFLVPDRTIPAVFGVTETVGSMPEERAKAFVKTVRDRMASCSDRAPGSDVVSLASSSNQDQDLSVWRVTSELNDNETVTYLMGIIRDGTAVGQVGFIPTRALTMAPGAFDTVVRRALARLAYQPRPKG